MPSVTEEEAGAEAERRSWFLRKNTALHHIITAAVVDNLCAQKESGHETGPARMLRSHAGGGSAAGLFLRRQPLRVALGNGRAGGQPGQEKHVGFTEENLEAFGVKILESKGKSFSLTYSYILERSMC